MSRRAEFTARVIRLLHTPYRWGGRIRKTGLDCWGVVVDVLLDIGGPDYTKWWTDVAWRELPDIDAAEVRAGDLAFYGGSGPRDVEHVMVVINPEGVVMGASGGGSAIDSTTKAHAAGAMVKVKEEFNYRKAKDFRGFRRIPFLDEEEAQS